MTAKIIHRSGSIPRARMNISNNLDIIVRYKLSRILTELDNYLQDSNLYFNAPPTEKWLTVKVHKNKAVLAFRNDKNGNLNFDIDTYASDDIDDPLNLLRLIPNRNKMNKRHVATITSETRDKDLNYLIQKMIEGIQKYEK